MISVEHGSDSSSILIVDDDPNFRALVKILLETTGCTVLEARSGKDADIILTTSTPALLIVDYRLPGLDGMQWITKIRESGCRIPIVFLSGTWCDLKAFTKLRSLLKVNLILQKPIVPELFLDQIETLLPRANALVAQQAEQTQDTYSSEVYSAMEPQAALREAYQSMDADLAHVQTHVEDDDYDTNTDLTAPRATSKDTDDLRSLFEKEVLNSQPAPTAPPTNLPAYGRDAMRKSATRMPAFKKPEEPAAAASTQTPTATPAAASSAASKDASTDSTTAPKFGAVALSKDSPEEMEIIESAEPDAIEQLVRFSQKANVEMALRAARADYARLLPEKADAIAEALTALKADPGNAEHYDEILQGAHQLKGTSGSLGFPHLGKTAGILEKLLLDGSARGGGNFSSSLDRISRQVAQLVQIARANALAYSTPQSTPLKAFVKKVALVGPYEHFAAVTHELAKDSLAEAYLIDNIATLLDEKETDSFNCVVVDSAALSDQSPTELLEQARQTARLQNAPFAFISDDSWHADEALWLYTGAEFLLPQTVSPGVLKSVVESMLELNDADKPRVLTVDDDVVLTGFICDTLSSNGITARALNEPINVLTTLQDFQADLVLLDVVMPGVSGYDVCRTLRADENHARMPILFLTSKNSQQGRAAAFKAGGDDFLSKPILTEELLTRVRSRLEVSEAFKKRAGTNNQTGLTTRQAFLESFTQSLDAAQQAGHVYTVAIIALHDFQELAVTFGFATQEKIFKDLAKLLQARFRVEDLKGHWSEGSFALAFPNVEAEVIHQAMAFLAGEFAVGTTHNSSGAHTMSKRLIRYGLGELLVDGVTADTMLSRAYENCMRSTPIDVSGFFELCQDDDAVVDSASIKEEPKKDNANAPANPTSEKTADDTSTASATQTSETVATSESASTSIPTSTGSTKSETPSHTPQSKGDKPAGQADNQSKSPKKSRPQDGDKGQAGGKRKRWYEFEE